MQLTKEDLVSWMVKTYEALVDQEEWLTELDRQIGDGDHGANMLRGFTAITDQLRQWQAGDQLTLQSISQILQKSAMTLMTAVGGASGALYSTAFLGMARAFQDEPYIDNHIFVLALRQAIEGIEHRGNVASGDKTLLDVWFAVYRLFQSSEQLPQAIEIELIARQAMEGTKKKLAKKGKAALYEQDSIGHIDPGAASSYLLFSSLAEVIKEYENE